jgi:hypothetical protein
MKKIFLIQFYLLVASFCFAQNKPSSSNQPLGKTKVVYTIATNYFLNNETPIAGDYAIAETQEEFLKLAGYAASMGNNGKPTPIDFNKQFVLILKGADTTVDGKIMVKSLTKNGKNLAVNYEIEYGEKLSYTANTFTILIINKKDNGKINFNKRVITKANKLTIKPLDNQGNLGQVTFSIKEATQFYFSVKENKGLINLNGKDYELTNYKFINNQGKGNKDGYVISGNGVSISAPNFTVTDNSSGGDCVYGKIPTVKITFNSSLLILKNVNVQDCPNY